MIVQSWDTANKSGELNDYSVCTTWGVRDGRYYLLHVLREKLNFPDLKRAARMQAETWRPQTILIEDKASGTQLIQELASEGVFGIKPYAPPPGTDKVLRLHAQATGFENGLVFLPREAHWLADYVNELTSFPGAKYDDQVDSTTQALAHMRGQSSSLEVWAKLGRDAAPILPTQRLLIS
jgi:predicted phage terminase large subunit-like protein